MSGPLVSPHLMLAMVLAHPCPVSPRPWRKMMVAVCFPLGATTTGSDILLRRVSALTPRLSPSPGALTRIQQHKFTSYLVRRRHYWSENGCGILVRVPDLHSLVSWCTVRPCTQGEIGVRGRGGFLKDNHNHIWVDNNMAIMKPINWQLICERAFLFSDNARTQSREKKSVCFVST